MFKYDLFIFSWQVYNNSLIIMYEPLLAVVAVVLIATSALCSGLNVALMALDITDLKRLAKLGNKDARIALKIRRKTHLSLASILFTNVAVISATSLLLSKFFNGFVAGLLSTLLIVIFGEILPQAFAVKHSLRAIALFAPFLRLITILTYPITKPLQLLLDKLIGPEDEKLHSRHELGLLIADHLGHEASELDEDEVEIVKNALQLSEKRVKEIMVPIEQVYYLSEGDVIDAAKIDELKLENYSRVPIFNKNKTRCERFLVLKDLVDIDFDSRSYTLDELKTHETKTFGSMTALDTMFRKFISSKKHLLIIEKDDVIAGVVTIEDLIEEILGHEIEDEGDVEKAKMIAQKVANQKERRRAIRRNKKALNKSINLIT
jgi:metal transporter CNNM